jgi:hypothetical protein
MSERADLTLTRAEAQAHFAKVAADITALLERYRGKVLDDPTKGRLLDELDEIRRDSAASLEVEAAFSTARFEALNRIAELPIFQRER